ncbi:hypothetical protein FF36_05971 [Frankia torreyi]|uniref:4Fe-4S Wbl-type domain-containing protein n=1 Tax=Frankia torreyi TaxID=1856 RepID=A0A0D8B6D0_9ACTN|nr:WhiB family transcriptional regulator [Frankia torreyi]KJE19716.1 hypothetical protein FF36_05971 [Frankia torreyi]
MTAPTMPVQAEILAVDPYELLALPSWSVPVLRAVVDGAPRPCADWPALFADAADAEDEAGDEGQDEAAGVLGAVVVGAARRVCAACPVRAECAALAMVPVVEVVDGQPVTVPYAPDGVYGGLTGRERAELAATLPMTELVAGEAVEVAVGRVPVARECAREGCTVVVPPTARQAARERRYCSPQCQGRAGGERKRSRRAASRPVCGREGCSERVPAGRVRYHSAECGRLVARAQARAWRARQAAARRAGGAVSR